MTIPLLDWPVSVPPVTQIIHAIGNTQDGFVSRAGFEVDLPIAGARNQLRMEFPPRQDASARWAGWIIQNARRGWFSVPLWRSPQLASSAALMVAEAAYIAGLPYSTEEMFSTGYGFLFNPTLDVVSAITEGSNTAVLDETRWPDALTFGNVFGMGRAVYHVLDIERDGTQATLTFSPPARRDIEAGEPVTLRPRMVCKPADIKSFIAAFEPADIIRPGSITMNEVIDENYL